MKRLGILMVMLLIVSGLTFAQERGGGERPSKSAQSGDRSQMTPEQMAQRQTQQMVEELKLTKDQEAKVTAINKKYAEKQPDWSKMREASDEERTKMREKMMKIQAEKSKEIKALLTADQVKLYDKMLTRPAQSGDRGGRSQMTPEQMAQRQTQQMVEELKLTKDQEAKLAAIDEKYAEKQPFDWAKMRDASDDERAKMREEMMKVQTEKNKEIKAILTADQVKLFDEMLKKREANRRNFQGGGAPGGMGL